MSRGLDSRAKRNPSRCVPGWGNIGSESSGRHGPRPGREFASDPCRRFPGSHQFRPRPKYFCHKSFAPLALTLEARPVNGGSGFDPGEFSFQRPDAP